MGSEMCIRDRSSSGHGFHGYVVEVEVVLCHGIGVVEDEVVVDVVAVVVVVIDVIGVVEVVEGQYFGPDITRYC